MKTVILYSSKTDTTRKLARHLHEKIENSTIIDLDKSFCNNVHAYDKVLIGSYIRVGKISKSIKKFIIENEKILTKKDVGIFLSCAAKDDEAVDNYFKENLPENIYNSARIKCSLGGEVDPEHFKGFEKMIIKMISKTDTEFEPTNFQRADELAKSFK